MYLYSLVCEKQDENENIYVNEITLLQHKNDYTQEEFEELKSGCNYRANYGVSTYLVENHGFRLVPQILI